MRMNVYLTTARKVLIFAYPTILSLFENNRDSEIYLYLVSEDLTEDDIVKENELAQQYGNHIIILKFDEEKAKGKIVSVSDHWPLGTLGCYWLFHELLPDDVDRILALETDTVITGSLAEFYQTDITGYYAACPDPEHKPVSHQELMKKLGGDVLTFVVSLYDVKKIKSDFTLDQILEYDRYVVREFGHSQQELTFGILFKNRIKFLPAAGLCVEENRSSMNTLGYDYLTECEKTCKVLHFSSSKDKGKPWNPVCIMPGFLEWWKYAERSPYYKEYFQRQWQSYDQKTQEMEKIKKNITYRNILLMIIFLFITFLFIYGIVVKQSIRWYLAVIGMLALASLITVLVRKISILRLG